MKILHLALEDHRRPGSGGGSYRNREINERLASAGHEVDVVAAGYPGARRRVERGVRYRHVGIPRGYAPSLLSYQAALPAVVAEAVARRRPDLVVEEFAPPWSSMGVGRWTTTPTVGLVQGFFAREKSAEYHIPLRLLLAIERWGTTSHRRLIAVSDSLADELRAVAPGVPVSVVGNGVDRAAIAAALTGHERPLRRDAPHHLVFLGRLELRQKGLDLLLEAFARIRAAVPVRLTIAGDGKDAGRAAALVGELGLGDDVTLAGAVSGEAKWRLLADADVLMMPSRYETFGIVALEAMACGTPVVAFDLDCLRGLVAPQTGVLVARFDTTALADATVALLGDEGARRRMAAAGPERARPYDWDALADAQRRVLEQVAAA